MKLALAELRIISLKRTGGAASSRRSARSFSGRLLAGLFAIVVAGLQKAPASDRLSTRTPDVKASSDGASVLTDAAGLVRFSLFTNAAPDARHVWNTLGISVGEESLLQNTDINSSAEIKPLFASPDTFHSLLVDQAGPWLAASNHLVEIARQKGPGWQFVAFDGTAGYQDRLGEYRRSLLLLEPGVLVVHDHAVSLEPRRFELVLHMPPETRLGGDWGDLRLETACAGLIVHAPSGRGDPRVWRCLTSEADAVLPRTVTRAIGPEVRVPNFDYITVYVAYALSEPVTVAFKLLESETAMGVRIYRNGYPSVAAFRRDLNSRQRAGLAGLEVSGPVAVSIYEPKKRPLLR